MKRRIAALMWVFKLSQTKNDGGLQLVMRGGDQAGVVSFGHRAALALAAAVDAGPVEQAAPRAGLIGRPAPRPTPGPSLCRTRGPPGCDRTVPRSGPWAGAGSARPRPRSRSTPRSPPLASKLDPGRGLPRGDRLLIALGGAVDGDLRGVADAVQQVRGAAQGVADVEQPAYQRGDPGQGPPLPSERALFTVRSVNGPRGTAWCRCRGPRTYSASRGMLLGRQGGEGVEWLGCREG